MIEIKGLSILKEHVSAFELEKHCITIFCTKESVVPKHTIIYKDKQDAEDALKILRDQMGRYKERVEQNIKLNEGFV